MSAEAEMRRVITHAADGLRAELNRPVASGAKHYAADIEAYRSRVIAMTYAEGGPMTFEQAARRVEYRPTYASTEPREFFEDGLFGPHVPNAYHDASDPASPSTQCGEWYHGSDIPGEEASQSEWLAHFAAMCVAEAVHEALEWYRVDGKPWLDPHGTHEQAIHGAVTELTDRLAKLAETP